MRKSLFAETMFCFVLFCLKDLKETLLIRMSIFYYNFNFTLCYLQYVIFYFQTPSILSLKAR